MVEDGAIGGGGSGGKGRAGHQLIGRKTLKVGGSEISDSANLRVTFGSDHEGGGGSCCRGWRSRAGGVGDHGRLAATAVRRGGGTHPQTATMAHPRTVTRLRCEYDVGKRVGQGSLVTVLAVESARAFGGGNGLETGPGVVAGVHLRVEHRAAAVAAVQDLALPRRVDRPVASNGSRAVAHTNHRVPA